ncbi:pyridoxal phosphate-dependent decarboxylase family protein [Streptomyces kanamyceticus]|uniref:Pyridoxal-dependent decarboxylase n=1 Tax=Streptomyces kanamyceticus TaxID=1967 RepID=A0A5J6GBX0_STRKN|nr:pyridoxal-dependent decarboxylase [Streptomyces kanamyceticus]QEU91311.1 pyridoxal-dependent decarboxylase [Streptomyces kanamyceticus]
MTTVDEQRTDEQRTAVFRPAGTPEGLEDLRTLVNTAIDTLRDAHLVRGGPVLPGGPPAVAEAARRALEGPLLPERPQAPDEVFRELIAAYANWAVDLTHPAAVARMQCPPTSVAIAAELVTATLNQSLHAWESGPFALELERYVVRELAELAGYGTESGGTLTAGGSLSNLMAVLAARDSVVTTPAGGTPFADGLANLGRRPVILCSDATHFSIGRAVGITGIGEDAILRAPADPTGRLIPDELDRMLAELPADTVPVAIIACAGSTDEGWVDPLPELVAVARKYGVWLHVDAAYGGGMLLSPRLRGRLAGIADADSITMDLHKFGWTPASTGVFLVRSARSLDALSQQTTTLNADDDKAAGYYGLYADSVQATRRVDALKVAVTLRSHGRDGMAELVDRCHELAGHAAERVAAEPRLELAAAPALSTVLLRWAQDPDLERADAFNGALRRRLMSDGTALLARTRVPRADGTNPVFLKLMLLNPATTTEQLDLVVAGIVATAEAMEAESAGTAAAQDRPVPDHGGA